MIVALPKSPQNHEKTWFWTSINYYILCVFLLRVFQKRWYCTGHSVKTEGPAVRDVSEKSWCFMFFEKSVSWRVQRSLFFDFGRFWGPPKSTMALQKVWFCLGESIVFKNSCFLLFYRSSEKTWFFINVGHSQITQKSQQICFSHAPASLLFRYRILGHH